jgi:hypothetical protein
MTAGILLPMVALGIAGCGAPAAPPPAALAPPKIEMETVPVVALERDMEFSRAVAQLCAERRARKEPWICIFVTGRPGAIPKNAQRIMLRAGASSVDGWLACEANMETMDHTVSAQTWGMPPSAGFLILSKGTVFLLHASDDTAKIELEPTDDPRVAGAMLFVSKIEKPNRAEDVVAQIAQAARIAQLVAVEMATP